VTIALVWLLQDLFQVVAAETLLVPDLFLLGLLAFGASEKLPPQGLLWSAFVGGLFWDVRWTGLFGFTAFLDVVAVWFFVELWGRIPQAGRTPFLLFFLALGLHVFVGLGHFLSWAELKPMESLFVNQQILALPIVVFIGWWGCRGTRGDE
jgi:hypothetical protein